MANEVNTYITITGNEEVEKKLQELKSRFKERQSYGYHIGEIFVTGEEGAPTLEDVYTTSWMSENVGSKWCFADEFEDGVVRLTSAWNYPEDFVQFLAQTLAEVDPTVIIKVTYEDEVPLFSGSVIYDGSELFDEQYYDRETIIELVIDAIDELDDEAYNWDDEEWNDEDMEDIFNDNLYDVIFENHSDFLDDCEKEIINNRKED